MRIAPARSSSPPPPPPPPLPAAGDAALLDDDATLDDLPFFFGSGVVGASSLSLPEAAGCVFFDFGEGTEKRGFFRKKKKVIFFFALYGLLTSSTFKFKNNFIN
jgi:hypothetical protein